MERRKPTLANKFITTIAITVIFFGILIIFITRYFITIEHIELEIANRILGVITISVILSISIFILIGFWLSKTITNPILSLNNACRRIMEGDLDVRVDVPKILCWKIKKCNKKECPAFENFSHVCWLVSKTLCREGKISEGLEQKIEDCKRCEVYKLYYNTQDEITELSLTFNYMAYYLKETIEKLNNAYKDIENEVLLKTRELNIAHQELIIEHKKIKEHEEELIAINKELDGFVYIVSHDLKEPLRGIETFSRFLKDDYWEKLDDEGKDYLMRILKGANRLKLFINDLLALSRISRIKHPYETFEPDDIVRDVLKRLDIIIKEKDANIKVDDSLPLLYGDKTKIKEVFYNLILNGIEYNDKKPVIEVLGEDKEDEVIISVKDNGIGMKEEDQNKVFEPFKRLSRRDEYGIGGIGLTIVKRIIDEHKGRIWVKSKPGEGSIFYLSLPKRRERCIKY